VSPIAQPDFLNTVVLASRRLAARSLLALAKRSSASRAPRRPTLGAAAARRRPARAWARRRSADARLTLPHPRLRERGFVLAPLAALAPELPLPPDDRTAGELLAELARDAWPRQVPWTRDSARSADVRPAGAAAASG
jgi:2-amino-4-hydroxy-6-hydroxymethyldihydropteridine diphosphokinase